MKVMDYPYPPIRDNVNGKDISILGVTHFPEFFKEHEPFFEEFISQQDALLLEESYVDFQEDDFFGKIGNIAKSQKKRIYQADPRNNLIIATDLLSFPAGLILIKDAAESIKTKTSQTETGGFCQGDSDPFQI